MIIRLELENKELLMKNQLFTWLMSRKLSCHKLKNKSIFVFLIANDAQGASGAAVVGVFKRNYFGSASISFT